MASRIRCVFWDVMRTLLKPDYDLVGMRLAYLSGMEDFEKLSRMRISSKPEDLRNFREITDRAKAMIGGIYWNLQSLLYRADLGIVTEQQFLDEVRKRCGFGFEISDERIRGIFENSYEISRKIFLLILWIESLGIIQAPITNIEPIQWRDILSRFRVLRLKSDPKIKGSMDFHVASYAVEALKPDWRIYYFAFMCAQGIYSEMSMGGKLRSDQCLFLDDLKENIESARGFGIWAEVVPQVSGSPDTGFIEETLYRYGIPRIPSDYEAKLKKTFKDDFGERQEQKTIQS